MNNYIIASTSRESARLIEPVVIEENDTTRKVMFVKLNDAKIDEGETVGITIVHQRKGRNDKWEEIDCINLNSLRSGEGVKLNLNSKNTKKIYDELTKLYELIDREGIRYGVQEFSIDKADEVIKVPKDRKTFIERLIKENYAEEVWEELISSDPELATRLSLARIQTNRSNALKTFRENLESYNNKESFWQEFFFKNDWIFGYGLNYQFLDILEGQPVYGGGNYTGRGSQRGDFLLHTDGDSKFTVVVEIKTPQTPLLSYKENKPEEVKSPRNDVWLLSPELIGAISQTQVNCRTWHIDSQKSENTRILEKNSIFTVEPKGILVIGNTEELNRDESIASCFESYRKNIKNPEIITFDELYKRAEFIVNNKNQNENFVKPKNDDDIPF